MGKFKLVEGCNAFYLYWEEEVACLGDGVDQEFLDENEDVITVGEEGFLEAWQRAIDEEEDTYMEAYFPSPACPNCGRLTSWWNEWVLGWQCPKCATIHRPVEEGEEEE